MTASDTSDTESIFTTCFLCDFVRPESHGKFGIFGFRGVCPYVQIGVPDVTRPAGLTLVLQGRPGTVKHQASIEILASDGRVVVATQPATVEQVPDNLIFLAPTLVMVLGAEGQYTVRVLVDGKEDFRTSFALVTAPPNRE